MCSFWTCVHACIQCVWFRRRKKNRTMRVGGDGIAAVNETAVQVAQEDHASVSDKTSDSDLTGDDIPESFKGEFTDL